MHSEAIICKRYKRYFGLAVHYIGLIQEDGGTINNLLSLPGPVR